MSKLQNAEFEASLAMAQDEVTPADVLTKLASSRDARIRQAAASNPNTPLEVLTKLGEEFPEEVIDNPIFNLSLLEDPNAYFIKLCLARSARTDEKILTQLACSDDEAIVLGVAGNPKTPIPILEDLIDNPPDFYYHENAETEDLDPLFIAIANNLQASDSLFTKLVDSGSSNVRMAILQNPKAPLSLLDMYARYRSSSMHRAIASNPATPAAILEMLAGENSKQIQEMVKQHPNVSPLVLATIDFVEGKSGKEISIEVLEKLASHHLPSVRSRVAVHPQATTTILEKLAQDSHTNWQDIQGDIPAIAARHPNANSTVLEFYAEHLVKHCGRVSGSNQVRYNKAAVELSRHPQVNPKILKKLSEIESLEVKSAIAVALPKSLRNM